MLPDKINTLVERLIEIRNVLRAAGSIWSHGRVSETKKSIRGRNQLGSSRLPAVTPTNSVGRSSASHFQDAESEKKTEKRPSRTLQAAPTGCGVAGLVGFFPYSVLM